MYGVQKTHKHQNYARSIPSIDENRGTAGVQSVRTCEENDR